MSAQTLNPAEMANPVQQGLKHREPLTYVQVAGLFNAEQTVHSLGFSADRMGAFQFYPLGDIWLKSDYPHPRRTPSHDQRRISCSGSQPL